MGNLSFGGAQSQSYLHYSKLGQIFVAQAVVTAPVGFGTAAATGGPLLWNGSGGTTSGTNNAQVDAVILGVSWGVTTAETTTNIALGLTGGFGQTAAPTSTTAIDGIFCTRIAPNSPSCSVFRKGTVSAAGTWFFPLATLSTTAVTAMPHQPNFTDLEGLFVVPPNSWISVAASVTGTAAVVQVGMIWAEIPRL